MDTFPFGFHSEKKKKKIGLVAAAAAAAVFHHCHFFLCLPLAGLLYWSHLAWCGTTEHVGMGQQPLRDAAGAEGAGSRRHGAAAVGFVRGEAAGAAQNCTTTQIVFAVPTGAVSHLLRKQQTLWILFKNGPIHAVFFFVYRKVPNSSYKVLDLYLLY